MERKRGAKGGQGREVGMRKREAAEAEVVGEVERRKIVGIGREEGEFSKGERERYPLQNDGSSAYDHFQSMQYTTISQPTAGDDRYIVSYVHGNENANGNENGSAGLTVTPDDLGGQLEDEGRTPLTPLTDTGQTSSPVNIAGPWTSRAGRTVSPKPDPRFRLSHYYYSYRM